MRPGCDAVMQELQGTHGGSGAGLGLQQLVGTDLGDAQAPTHDEGPVLGSGDAEGTGSPEP